MAESFTSLKDADVFLSPTGVRCESAGKPLTDTTVRVRSHRCDTSLRCIFTTTLLQNGQDAESLTVALSSGSSGHTT